MLPKLATPKYDMIVPSTGESITYRPYVVREEKILLIAFESQDESMIEKAVLNIIETCVESKISIKALTNFDIEYMFVTLRSKSVGEGIKLTLPCKECEEPNELKIDLDKVIVANLEDVVDKHIKITDDISIDVKWQTVNDNLKKVTPKTETDGIIQMVASGIETVYSGEEIFASKDVPKKELIDFVESLSTDQFTSIVDVLQKAPYLSYKMEYKCNKCGEDNERSLNGLIDFFQ